MCVTVLSSVAYMLIQVNVFAQVRQLEKKKHSESDSSDIVPQWDYRYCCGVAFSIFIELEQLLKLYILLVLTCLVYQS